jgi:hypothetical protein
VLSRRLAGAERVVLSRLERLEAESIHILREAVSEARHPVMLYSPKRSPAACKPEREMRSLRRGPRATRRPLAGRRSHDPPLG